MKRFWTACVSWIGYGYTRIGLIKVNVVLLWNLFLETLIALNFRKHAEMLTAHPLCNIMVLFELVIRIPME